MPIPTPSPRTLSLGHTTHAPWTVIRSDDKRRARLAVIRAILRGVAYDGKDEEVVGAPDPMICGGPEMWTDHSSRRPPDRYGQAGYHHGNLKQALVDAALHLIEANGPTGFTLSEAAKTAGVTPAAVYRHFEGRDELIANARGRATRSSPT